MMKLAAALLVLAVAGTVAAFVVVYSGNRDTAPDALRSCLQDLGLPRIIGNDALGPAAPDLRAGRLVAREQVALKGGGQATLLVPADRAYTLVAVTRHPSPPAVVRHRVAAHPESLVELAEARTAPLQRAVRACVREQAA